jgi:hypothetical protein
LKVKVKTLGMTRYQTKDDLFSHYLRAELATPRIQVFQPEAAKGLRLIKEQS